MEMSRHSRIFHARNTAPIVIINVPLESPRLLPQTPRPAFSSFIHDFPEPATPRSPSCTRGSSESSVTYSVHGCPVFVRTALIVVCKIILCIMFFHVCVLVIQLKFFRWLAAFDAVKPDTSTVSDECNHDHVDAGLSAPSSQLPLVRARSSSSSTRSSGSSIFSFDTPFSPGDAVALPQSLLDQISAEPSQSPTDMDSNEGDSPIFSDSDDMLLERFLDPNQISAFPEIHAGADRSWDSSSSTAYESLTAASSPSSPSSPSSYSSSSSSYVSVGRGVNFPSIPNNVITAVLSRSVLDPIDDDVVHSQGFLAYLSFDSADPSRLRLNHIWDQEPVERRRRKITKAFCLAQRYIVYQRRMHMHRCIAAERDARENR